MVEIDYNQDGEQIAKPSKREELSIVKAELRDKLFNLRKQSASFSNIGKLDDDSRMKALKINKEIEYLRKIKRSLNIDNPKLMNAYQLGLIDKSAEKVVSFTENNYRAKLMNKYKSLALHAVREKSNSRRYKGMSFLGTVK